MEKSNYLNSDINNDISKSSTDINNNILNSILDETHIQQDISKNTILNDVSGQLLSDEEFWINNPEVLIDKKSYLIIWPTETMSKNEKLNTLSRLIIYITIIGFIFTYSFKILISGMVTLCIFVFLYYSSKNNKKEQFCNFSNIGNFYISPDITNRFTMPTSSNPTMNVMIPEINDNPDRNMAAPSYNPVISEKINDSVKEMVVNNFDDSKNVKDKLFNDLGDNFQFEQSMRNFYTTANTNVPNNQGDFAKFCYGDMISCKEGNNLACVRHNPNHINI
tara:strand:- start:92 stop:925 length:834 start_codon:yes stop_codon:yes gene_type:complete